MKNKLTTLPAQLTTPVEIVIPTANVMDHGLSLVHELGGKPRNYLHEVSVEQRDQNAIQYLEAASYTQRCGWVKDGLKYWTYQKSFPLTVAAW